jgi:hypothetical protein
MRLARQSREELEEFFGDRLDSTGIQLSEINFYVGPLSRLLIKIIGVSGLTLGRNVFVISQRDEHGRRRIHAALAVHEICHVLQYETEGFAPFVREYFAGYWQRLRKHHRWDALARQLAYLEIPAETEARTAEHDFVRWRREGGRLSPPRFRLNTTEAEESRMSVPAMD